MISKVNELKFVRFVLLTVCEEAKACFPFYFFHSLYNKTVIKFGFVISRIINFSLRVISLSLQLWLITPQPLALADNPYLNLDYSGHHKNLIQ